MHNYNRALLSHLRLVVGTSAVLTPISSRLTSPQKLIIRNHSQVLSHLWLNLYRREHLWWGRHLRRRALSEKLRVLYCSSVLDSLLLHLLEVAVGLLLRLLEALGRHIAVSGCVRLVHWRVGRRGLEHLPMVRMVKLSLIHIALVHLIVCVLRHPRSEWINWVSSVTIQRQELLLHWCVHLIHTVLPYHFWGSWLTYRPWRLRWVVMSIRGEMLRQVDYLRLLVETLWLLLFYCPTDKFLIVRSAPLVLTYHRWGHNSTTRYFSGR
jgi:hypothetical protein